MPNMPTNKPEHSFRSLMCNKRSQRGQGLVEYSLILLLVALAVIGGLMLLAPVITHGISGVLPAL